MMRVNPFSFLAPFLIRIMIMTFIMLWMLMMPFRMLILLLLLPLFSFLFITLFRSRPRLTSSRMPSRFLCPFLGRMLRFDILNPTLSTARHSKPFPELVKFKPIERIRTR